MKILIVEDNMILCGMIEKWLQKAGYEVLTAIDEPGARSILKKNEINLVLGDVRLPEGDGISLLEWMMRSKSTYFTSSKMRYSASICGMDKKKNR